MTTTHKNPRDIIADMLEEVAVSGVIQDIYKLTFIDKGDFGQVILEIIIQGSGMSIEVLAEHIETRLRQESHGDIFYNLTPVQFIEL